MNRNQSNKDKEVILYESKYFNVVERQNKVGLLFKKVTIGVLPYTIDNNILSSVGVLNELNYFREGDYCKTLITGTADADDPTLLHTAIRELHEESGIECLDVDKWIFLGSFRLSKSSTEYCHVFGVNVTDLEINEPKGDGSEQEKKSKFELTAINDAILTDEAIFLAAYLRLFDFFYQQSK